VIGIARAYSASATYGWYWTTDFGGYVDAPPALGPTPTRTATPTRTPTPQPTATWPPKDPSADTDGDGIPNSIDPDDDNDGCTDVQELAMGSNPHNFWDFYDVWTRSSPTSPWVRDKQISLVGDLRAVAQRFGSVSTAGASPQAALRPPLSETGYHAAFDRSPGMGPPDGTISLVDLFLMMSQFGESCR
jgi:hypothetical protein